MRFSSEGTVSPATAKEWLEILQAPPPQFLERLSELYGDHPRLIADKVAALSALVGSFKEPFGDSGGIYVVRSPGRLNTLGMHVDHRGAFVNPMAIQKEILLCFRPRPDDVIQVQNADPACGKRTFSISEELPEEKLKDVDAWLRWTQGLTDERIKAGTNPDWVNKLKAVPVYFAAMLFPGRPLKGFDGLLTGDIPQRIGLSSSSAVVVAMVEALNAVNDIQIAPDLYAYTCGVAEWYVGTRGGFGDHAAIKFARAGHILQVKTTPSLQLAGYLPFPAGCAVIVFASGIEADKTGAAGQKFNEKTATYEIGEMILKGFLRRKYLQTYEKIVSMRKNLPADVKKVHLADLVEDLSDSGIHSLVSELPGRMDRKTLVQKFPGEEVFLRKQFATHLEPSGGYHIRSVILYGLAESKRALMLADVLKEGDVKKFGELMNASHNGDRVTGISENLRRLKNSVDAKLPLYLQIGDYDCSVAEIDGMVDIALANGALGAQVSGAGLGGSMMALVEEEKAEKLIEAMRREYFEPMGIPEQYLSAIPVGGACII